MSTFNAQRFPSTPAETPRDSHNEEEDFDHYSEEHVPAAHHHHHPRSRRAAQNSLPSRHHRHPQTSGRPTAAAGKHRDEEEVAQTIRFEQGGIDALHGLTESISRLATVLAQRNGFGEEEREYVPRRTSSRQSESQRRRR